ncbi:MAG: 4Fe-4S cluster-binding domain-containing protein [Gallionella sp.]|nr:4Fe-4S cluster-binding domain-containing protein [Gallionella sp.]
MDKSSTLNLAAFLPQSRANGPGLRSVLWVQGCSLRCAGCFNPGFQPFAGGYESTVDEVIALLLAQPDTEGVSFSGGEPFSQATALAEVAEAVRAAGKGVLIFTGQDVATLKVSRYPGVQRLLAAADLLAAGPYRCDLPQRHPLLASTNQELLYLTERYLGVELGSRRSEFRIGVDGEVSVTGFPVAMQPASIFNQP